MKFQKLDQKQMPQVIALGVLAAGILAYGGYNLMSGSSANQAQADTTAQPVQTEGHDPQATAEAEAKAGPEEVAQAQVPGMPLPGTFTSDPFKPTVSGKGGASPGPRPAPAQPTNSSPGPSYGGPGLPAPGGPGYGGPGYGGPGVSAPPPAAAPEPQKPARPDVAVTGVIDMEKGSDMALVEVGSEQRIIQVGDRLPNDYRVKRIALDGVLLVHSGGDAVLPDRYFVAVGNKSPLAPPVEK